ncbi:hypothetical protein ACULMC_06775 [Xanthomonas arboricola pv. corylina]|uniref:hypothetical protein n=1 Tax=Xanthomonas arboricola TaxID=56448 RepID=UPI0011B02A2E|nr:hypothetical protein [Xanthomonas arboricola]
MKIWNSLLLLGIGLLGFHEEAAAQAWIVCDNCTTLPQFESVAQSRHGQNRGTAYYGVVNPGTEQFFWVEVTYTPAGEQPLSLPAVDTDGSNPASVKRLDFRTANGTGVIGVSTSSSYTSQSNQGMVTASGGRYSTYGMTPSDIERQQFVAIARISKDQVFVVPDNSTSYFDSYEAGYHDHNAALDQVVRTALTINNPAWAAGSLTSLFSALKSFYGRGPTGCVVFGNGDTACFQTNVAAPGALRVIEGTAKHADGSAIANDSAAVPGGGASVTVQPNVPSQGMVTYYMGKNMNGPFITCTMVNGVADKCKVQF